MNLQAIEQGIVKGLTAIGHVAEDVAPVATSITAQIPNFINLADEAKTLVDDGAKALSGANKLALVKAMAEAAFKELNLSDDAAKVEAAFGAIWTVIGPAVTILVQLRNLGFVKF